MKQITINPISYMLDIPISESETSAIYPYGDEVLKLFEISYLKQFEKQQIDLEAKIKCAKELTSFEQLVLPTAICYDEYQNFVGYTMPKIEGISMPELERSKTLFEQGNLYQYGLSHLQLEKMVKKGHELGIIFPDLGTGSNLIFSDGSWKLIDYDGLQIQNHGVLEMSSLLGNPMQYENNKYKRRGLYTKELDKKSLIYLYFLNTFNIDLNAVGKYDPALQRTVRLKDIFQMIGLEDERIMKKVEALYQRKEENPFLEDDVLRLASEYQLGIRPLEGFNNTYQKRLIKK